MLIMEPRRCYLTARSIRDHFLLEFTAEFFDARTPFTEHELTIAGFIGINYDLIGDIHCFQVNGIELSQL